MADNLTNPSPQFKPNPLVAAGMKYSKEVILLVCVFIAFGIYALNEMNKNEFPSFTIREGVVAAVYPGATVKQIEQEVLKPLEDYVFSYKEIDKKKTHSRITSGMAIIFVELDDNVSDSKPFWNEFKIGMQQVKLSLPPGVLGVETLSNFGDTSALLITMQSDDKTYRELKDYMDELKSRLRNIESVGTMSVSGMQTEEFAVYLNPEKLKHYALSEATVGATLLTQGFQTTGGSLRDGYYANPIVVKRTFSALSDIADMIVFSSPDGSIVRLKDIADIKREYPDPNSYVTNNFQKCILLSVQMKEGYNIVAMGAQVDEQLKAFEQELPDDVTLFKITDQPTVVNSSVNYFLVELLVAIVAVVVAIMLLLPFRVALIAASTIPIAIFISLGLFYIFDIELNTVTLACLIVTLGMIVDNSVVIIDNYVELISEGMDHLQATHKAGTEFFKAIFSATLAISVTFFPFLITITGMFRDFLTDFPWCMTIILLVSLLVAELLVPYLQYKLIKKPIYKLQQEALASGKKKFSIFISMQNGYNKLIDLCFNYPRATIALSLLCAAVGAWLFISRPLQLMPIAERNQFAVEITLPTGTEVARTTQVADSLEAILSRDPRVVSIASFHGCASPRFQTTYAPQVGGPNYAQFIVNTQSNQATIDVLNDYTEKYEGLFPDAFVRFKQLSYSMADYPVEIRFSGADPKTLHAICDTVAQIARKVPGLRNVRLSLDNPLALATVSPDKTRAERMGLTSTLLETTLAMRYSDGLPITTVWEGDYGIPVTLKTPTSRTGNIAELEQEPIPVIGLGTVPLRQISDIKAEWHPGMLIHYNGNHTVSVIAEVQRNINVIDRTEALMDSISQLQLPENVDVTRGGEWEQEMDTLPQIVMGLVLAVVVIFFILFLHYAQADTSILVVTSLLLCIPGAALGLIIQDTPLSLTCVLGIVSLMGIMVRNAIVLLDYAEELRNQGQNVHDSVLNASKRRMRPIFLTSAAATMGVLPMVMGDSALWQPMGVVIFWGTPITMIFILTTIPVAYSLMKGRQKGADQPLPKPMETHLL